MTSGGSACLERSREKGGRATFIQRMVSSFLRDTPLLTIPQAPSTKLFGRNIFYTIWGEKVSAVQFIGAPFLTIENGKKLCKVPFSLLWGKSVAIPESKEKLLTLDYDRITRALLFKYLMDSGDLVLPDLKKPSCVSEYGPFFSLWDSDPCLDPDQIKFATPFYKAEAVDDPGVKARVITVGSGAWGTLGHLFRTVMYHCMKMDSETILSENADGAFSEWFWRVNKSPKSETDRYLSVDLTSATDTFNADICQALARGAVDAIRSANKPIWRMCALIVRRNVSAIANIEYPKWISSSLVVQTRGVLMGNAESWTVLNLYNKFFTRLGEQLFRLDPLLPKENINWSHPTVLKALEVLEDKALCISKRCGDDQVSRGPVKAHEFYLKTLTLSGAIPSPGTNVISKRVITFTQSLASENAEGKVGWIDIVRIISLVDWKGLNRLPSIKEVPRIWFRGLSYYLALRWWGVDAWQKLVKKNLLLFGQYLCSSFIRKASSMGLEPFLSISLGGLNFPHPGGKELSHVRPRVLRAISYLIRDDQRPSIFLERQSLNIWTLQSSGSLLSRRVEVVLDRIFAAVFHDDARLSLESPSVFEDPGWFDLNQLRSYMKIDLPLNEINLRVLQVTLKEWKVVPIGNFWKETSQAVRAIISHFTPPDTIQNPEQRVVKKAQLFQKKIKDLLKGAGSFSSAYSPDILKKKDIFFLEKRCEWADHYFFVTNPTYELISKYYANYFVEEARTKYDWNF